jgi:pyrimidine-nucleoside phosphorylase
MRPADVIIAKRDGEELSTEQIRYFIEGYTSGAISEEQASSLAMAILLNGMSDRETTDLTLAMANSGETLDLTGVVEFALDKHSTGGVGDKTTLVVENSCTSSKNSVWCSLARRPIWRRRTGSFMLCAM